ncbi:MAG: restriction endonuclease subunit S [Breznakibacter sp.]
MKKLKLTDIAPYSGKRVQPFDGVKRYMSTGDLQGDNLSFEDVTYETKPSRADILVSEGDILFAKMTNTNKALQIDKEHDGIIVSTGFSVHRPLENEMFGEYFLQFLKHDSFQRQKNKLCTGAIQSAISNSGIEKILVPVPDFDDQLHIANLLSKAENLIAQRKESIRLLDEFLKSTFSDIFDNPVKNRKGFEIVRFKELITFLTSGGRGWGEYYCAIGERFIRSLDVQMNYISNVDAAFVNPPNNQEANRTKVRDLDILLTITGSKIGRVAMVPINFGTAYVSQHVAIIRTQNVNPLYLSYYLSDINCGQYLIQKSFYGQTKPGLNFKQIENFEIVLPPIELQIQFAQIVEKTEVLKTQYQQSLQELENLYGSLSQKAFRGELIQNKEEVRVIALKPEINLIQHELTKQQAFLRKLMLASHIIYELCDEPTFGHTKLMKLLYLSEQAGGMALQTNYKKFAAGPFDGKTLTLIDLEYEKNDWFAIEKRSYTISGQQREATIYKKTGKSLLYKKHYDNYFEQESETINRIISLFKKEKTQTAEIVATLYFAWKELMAANTIISEDSLVKAFYQFHKEKKKFTEEQILQGHKYMLTNELYPHSA